MENSEENEKKMEPKLNNDNKSTERVQEIGLPNIKNLTHKKTLSSDKNPTNNLETKSNHNLNDNEDNNTLLSNDGFPEINLVKHLMKMKPKPSIKHLTKFANRLNRVVSTINNLDGVKIMYKYSDELNEKIRNNVQELECLTLEIKATLNNLNKLKAKRVLICNEKNILKEACKTIKREEIQEMETVIAIYDKDLLRSWQMVKKSSSLQSIENFIINLKGKQQAMEYVFQLASEKLLTLKNKLGKQSKLPKKTAIKAIPPPSSDSDQDSIFSTD